MSRRGENIYKRKDGRWEARYVKEISVDGKKIYGSVYAHSYQEVKCKQLEMVSNNAKISTKRVSLIVDDIMYEWICANKHNIKYSTYVKYKTIIEKHISPFLGNIQVNLLSSKIISKFIENKLSCKHSGRALSVTTVNNILVVLGMGLEYAENEYKINLPKVQLIKQPKKEMRVLTIFEQKTLVNYLINHMDNYSFGILFALCTGIRIGELCALQWSDIVDGKIKITKTMQRINKNGKSIILITEPKTDKSKRIIPVPPVINKLIVKKRKANGYVIHQENNKFIEPRLMQKKFAQIVNACGLQDIHFHTLRHTFATRCVEAGFDIKTLSEILGHTDVKTTLNRYVHSSFELKQKNMNKLKFVI